jgi:hypothetical protein
LPPTTYDEAEELLNILCRDLAYKEEALEEKAMEAKGFFRKTLFHK